VKWGGRRATAWTQAVLTRYGRACILQLPGCTVVATTGDHVIPKSERPDLAFEVTNGRPACRPCNSRRQRRPLPRVVDVDEAAFFESAAPGRKPSRPISPPQRTEKPDGARP
jgi:5-methylcytosine-specific restriction endonuclease McrA